MNGNPLPPKKEVALALLERGSVHVHLDPRAVGVVVPAWFKRQPSLVLQVGLNMAVPIPDLRVDDDGMSCTLSFNRSPFFCIVPWSAAYAMVGDDGRGMIWPEDVPPEVALQGRSREADAAAKKAAPERTLAVVRSAVVRSAVVKSAPEASAKPKRGARSRTNDDAGTTRAPAAKKPRAKKPRGEPTNGTAMPEARQEPGVLIPIAGPSTPAKPARRIGPAPKPAAATRRPVASPGRAEPPPAPPPKQTPHGSPSAGKPGPGSGKPKREIPPYLRVVK